MKVVGLLILGICSIVSVNGDIFTSIADLQRLLAVEKNIPTMLRNYIEAESKRLEEIRYIAKKYQTTNDDLQKNMSAVSNPINAFRMIKRLTNSWKELEDMMRNDHSESFMHDVQHNYAAQFPKDEDLSGAAVGILRLQDTYRLDTHELANGIVRNQKISEPLTAHDCFEIGRMAYNTEDYYHTILWMGEALERIKSEDEPTADEADILEYYGFALYKQDNVKRALLATDRLLELTPNHPRAKGNVKWYEDQLISEGVKRSDFRRKIPRLTNIRPVENFESTERSVYEALCRDEIQRSVKETSKLYCYYKMDRPFLRLAPFKVEILRYNPLAVFFRDVISDEEVEIIQMLAKPKLARATVQNSQTGKLETASYRISKSAWLKEEVHEVVKRINNRIDYMTNLEQETAEELQIANYGIGGHYDPHFDFARKEEVKAFSDLGTGNRIATVLFYMTQPEMGGGTVFTELQTTVMPSKNDALFWYNLLPSGEGDLRTRHAACPVLLGVKWVSNKWIHEAGQEFRRPCGLKMSTQERFVGDLGGPEPRFAPNYHP
uniref:procollagen-proline 4-dioxygenase n=1 Tax=Panagrellus redivivus TaxID=6233 RepID=A0A7E4WAF9_PANRE